MATSWFSSLVFVFCGVIIGLDPFNYIVEDFLPHPYHRSIEIVVTSFLARLLLSSLCGCEFARFTTFFVFLFTLMALLTVSGLKNMLQIRRSSCVHFYIQLRIIFAWAFAILSDPFGLLMFLTHLATVYFLWFGIRCKELLPLILVVISVAVGIFLITYATYIFRKCVMLREIAERIITTHKIKNFSRRANKVNRKYYDYSQWKSQIPVGVPCGSLFTIRKSFTMAYLRELVGNLANAVLLIKPASL